MGSGAGRTRLKLGRGCEVVEERKRGSGRGPPRYLCKLCPPSVLASMCGLAEPLPREDAHGNPLASWVPGLQSLFARG